MTSLLTSVKTTASDTDYYINVGSLAGAIYALNTTSGAFNLSSAAWASLGPNNTAGGTRGNALMSTLVGATGLTTAGGAILKDMGKTIVSSLRTFRKVQLVVSNSNPTLSTFGVRGQSGSAGEDYFSGYIEMGFEGNGVPAPVAHFGR
jgi:hypothetical protein